MASSDIAGVSELRRLIGDMDDTKLSAILALEPTVADIEEAIAWTEGSADTLGNGPWPLTGKVAEIFEILVAGLAEESEH